MKKAPTLAEASPYKSVAEELKSLRRTFRNVCQRYAARIDSEIAGLHDQVVAAGTVAAGEEKADGQAMLAVRPMPSKPSASSRTRRARVLTQVHELRDMLTLLRTLPVRPADGRRKDLKKIESVIEDLRSLTAKWG